MMRKKPTMKTGKGMKAGKMKAAMPKGKKSGKMADDMAGMKPGKKMPAKRAKSSSSMSTDSFEKKFGNRPF